MRGKKPSGEQKLSQLQEICSPGGALPICSSNGTKQRTRVGRRDLRQDGARVSQEVTSLLPAPALGRGTWGAAGG